MSTGVNTAFPEKVIPTIKETLLTLDDRLPKTYPSKKLDAFIPDVATGGVLFELKDVEAPQHWGQTAVNIVADKYFAKGKNPETSVYTCVNRICKTLGDFAVLHKYIPDEDKELFVDVFNRLMLGQFFSFNSPVWFNVGLMDKPRISACFILGIQDTMESILDNARIEGMIYKYGSGSGINYSPLRGKSERLSRGGVSSGTLSFMDIGDAVAGSIKSGGTTRRAAKMVILDVDHPDVEDFIACKVAEEEKAQALIDAGYSSDFRDENGAYSTVKFQNANHTVRVTDEFMKAVEVDEEWPLVGRVKTTEPRMVSARALYRQIAEAAWKCGDPGLQFDTIINKWNTLKAEGRINGSNPCSEYMSLDNTSCNLASVNLMKFRLADGEFDYGMFNSVCYLATVGLDVLICEASYPTQEITDNVLRYRQVGLGYANLGALIMSKGLAYDSDEARCLAGGITACMNSAAWAASVALARTVGPFPAFEDNKSSLINVLRMHSTAITTRSNQCAKYTNGYSIATDIMNGVQEAIEKWGVRNSYVTNIAPTGTIGFGMGCDTMGIEPELALVKYKKLVGGGLEKLVNGTVRLALQSMGISEEDIQKCLDYISKKGCLDDTLGIRALEDRLNVFDTSFSVPGSKRVIHWSGHVKMMAAVQPYLSGAISKTVNMPEDSTPQDIESAYKLAWTSKLKCIAIYRDNCKKSQPLNTTLKKTTKDSGPAKEETQPVGRKKLPTDRDSKTHKFSIGGHDGYITVGMYEDGTPGELFLTVSKEGSFVSGLLDSFATMVSIALQHGAPVSLIVDKLKGHSYEPQGITGNPDIRFAKSLSDYIGRFLELKFLRPKVEGQKEEKKSTSASNSMHTPPCPECGGLTAQSGSCHVCQSCGTTTGCS